MRPLAVRACGLVARPACPRPASGRDTLFSLSVPGFGDRFEACAELRPRTGAAGAVGCISRAGLLPRFVFAPSASVRSCETRAMYPQIANAQNLTPQQKVALSELGRSYELLAARVAIDNLVIAGLVAWYVFGRKKRGRAR